MGKRILVICIVLSVCLAAPAFAGATEAPCPWKISAIKVGKWSNGNHKARIWVRGSFPIPPGVSERPTWYVNGRNVGHSTIFLGERTLPNASDFLREGSNNTIEVKFLKPPYNGAGEKKIISDFSWDKVKPGQYETFN